jgi:hypothetical protein
MNCPRTEILGKISIIKNFLSYRLYCFCHFSQEFVDAKEPISFFIQSVCGSDSNVHIGSLDNPQTKERLVIKWSDQDQFCVTISRHPMEATEEWIEGMQNKHWNKYRHIYI